MKQTIQFACCALGSGVIGYFANQLNTVAGSVLFTIGIVMLLISIVLMTKQDKENQ